ncbi:hypothetical protein ABG79_00117 [Caloramator mitchellensis]|uniref:Uncharacterized protein n=1 Tax=Caloramator mitchellensis TaxID=908809 RepID=A0A0R3JWK0_CALMK|nr:DUF6762 family protein [Caloramator mitchellensis]KRQ87952.1 hypothetical protein ABG79_00117 [Caloramator mitchellensis]
MEGKALVLYKRENGILTEELGSYEIEVGLEFVYKAYVEDGKCYLFLTTDKDVTDEQYNEVYEMYNIEKYNEIDAEIEEVEEYNPTWLFKFDFKDDYEYMSDILNDILYLHQENIKQIFAEFEK